MHVQTADPCKTESSEVKKIIEEWYLKLDFPESYNREFYEALEKIDIADAITLESYDKNCEDGARNLLSFLLFASRLESKYEQKGIDKAVLFDTLKDIVTWTNIWSRVKGRLYLGELSWLSRHLSMKLFRLGRLQFYMVKDKNGKNVVEIHIPKGAPLSPDECEASLDNARVFFSKYFPDFEYEYFTCHSWLLDSTLKELLNENSNIIKFQNMFDITKEDESYALLRYVFTWDTDIHNVRSAICNSAFAERVKEYVLLGKKFHEGLGYIKK